MKPCIIPLTAEQAQLVTLLIWNLLVDMGKIQDKKANISATQVIALKQLRDELHRYLGALAQHNVRVILSKIAGGTSQ